MKKNICITLIILFIMTSLLYGCREENNNGDAISIVLSDSSITADGEILTHDISESIYTANDIIYYPEGKDFTFGEAEEYEVHSAEDAQKHTVLHITSPGTYMISGNLSCGQIAVDLGEEAKEDKDAVVNLIFAGVDINCDVAPAVIFYNVYECSSTDAQTASKDVDTSDAGANVIIADNSINNITGSHVAKIYKSYELNEEKTEVVDSKKLHKYDGAFYSKMSMNILSGNDGSGILNIIADNEGLDSELHLTINGGTINITSGNDGINTNEDNVSVTTINGGEVNITVTGATGEGDGIDSNGWLVINGGKVTSYACSLSGDSGIDSDMGIYLNGGEVIATGNMLEHISGTESTYAVFTFSSPQKSGTTYTLKDGKKTVMEITPENDFSVLIVSSEDLIEGTYQLYAEGIPLAHSSSAEKKGFGEKNPFGERPDGEEFQRPDFTGRPERPEDEERPSLPDGTEIPDDMKFPEGMKPEDGTFNPGSPGRFGGNDAGGFTGKQDKDFVIQEGGNNFGGVAVYVSSESI